LPSASVALEADLVLSSGFLAFGNHAGFLRAVVARGVRVSGIMGTSAGAMTGSMFAAGYSPDDILRETCRDPPWRLLRPSWRFWEGLFSLDAVVERLRELLPPTFEDLDKDFACAVLDRNGKYIVLDSGALPEAVAASAAIPFLFRPVEIPGREAAGPFADGGARERIGLGSWRERVRKIRPPPANNANDASASSDANSIEGEAGDDFALVHLIQRSFGPLSGNDKQGSQDANFEVVTSPKSGVTLVSLGDYEQQYQQAFERTNATLERLQREAATKKVKKRATK